MLNDNLVLVLQSGETSIAFLSFVEFNILLPYLIESYFIVINLEMNQKRLRN